jgi:hypothetical protein
MTLEGKDEEIVKSSYMDKVRHLKHAQAISQ